MKTELPERKHPRLKAYDYSLPGEYFVTICAHNRRCLFSEITERGTTPDQIKLTEYGKIAEEQLKMLEKRYSFLHIDTYVIMPNHIHVIFVFDDIEAAGASPRPTGYDRSVQTAGASPRPTGYDRTVQAAGASPRPTVMDVVCTFKSLTTRKCKETKPTEKIFQSSFHEHIIRDKEDYDETVKYIFGNPAAWFEDELYSDNYN